jgi:hypothetical protein
MMNDEFQHSHFIVFAKEQVMFGRTCWLVGVALMSWGAVATAQVRDPETGMTDLVDGVFTVARPLEREYWLGISCVPVPLPLRTHLNLPAKQGLMVEAVVPDSPAAKAGIARHDVLMRASDKPLAEPQDLIRAIEATQDGKLQMELIRAAKAKSVEVTPAKRPAEVRGQAVAQPAPGDWQTMEKWLEGMWPGGVVKGQRSPMRFRIFHPGAIVPPDAVVPSPLPPNMSIAISKEGDQPVKIVVKRGQQKWEVTEKELDKLPADVRPHVARMLGHGPLGIVGGLGSVDVLPKPPMPGRAWEGRFEKRFDEMSQRMDKLLRAMEEMAAGRAHHPTPEKPTEK